MTSYIMDDILKPLTFWNRTRKPSIWVQHLIVELFASRANIFSIKCIFDEMYFRSNVISIKCIFDQMYFRANITSGKCKFEQMIFRLSDFRANVYSGKYIYFWKVTFLSSARSE